MASRSTTAAYYGYSIMAVATHSMATDGYVQPTGVHVESREQCSLTHITAVMASTSITSYSYYLGIRLQGGSNRTTSTVRSP